MIKHVWLKINGLHEWNITDDNEEEVGEKKMRNLRQENQQTMEQWIQRGRERQAHTHLHPLYSIFIAHWCICDAYTDAISIFKTFVPLQASLKSYVLAKSETDWITLWCPLYTRSLPSSRARTFDRSKHTHTQQFVCDIFLFCWYLWKETKRNEKKTHQIHVPGEK